MKQLQLQKNKIIFKAFLLEEHFLIFLKRASKSSFTKGVCDFHIDSESSFLFWEANDLFYTIFTIIKRR